METDVNGDDKKKLKVQLVCKALGYSRQAYYQARTERRKKAVNERFVIDAVIQARIIHPRCGTRKLLKYTRETLLRAGLSIGRDRFFDILRIHDMLIKRRKAFEPKTTQFDSTLPLSPNLVTGHVFDGPNQVFVADITYIRCTDRFLFLTLITDLFSKDIIGWYLSDDLKTGGCLKALNMAYKIVPPGVQVILHSDRGCQFASHEFRDKLTEYGMISSMTEELHCYENSIAERVNGILKQEYYLDIEFKDYNEALKAVKHVINVYNELRIHNSLGDITPVEARRNPELARQFVVAIQEAAIARAEARKIKLADAKAKGKVAA